MGKNKRDATTPRRRVSLSKKRTFDRTIVKVISRPNSAAATTQPRSNANIRVVVRVRPPNSREEGDNHRCVIKVVDDQMLVFDPKIEEQGFFFHGVQQKGRDLLKKAHKDMKFVFDKVFSQESATEDVFKNTTFSLIDSLMEGFNCSVFAYGATGAGKTFTMTGNSSTPGVTFLTMTELFRKKDELSEERDFEIGITYLEVYNELVKDLLNPGPPLNLREDAKYGVTVAGIKLYEIKSPNELFSLLEQGNKNRTQHPTDANSESSRSHAVFQVYLKMTIKSTKQIRTAKLSMIDLAGSERGSATGFVGARFTEGANINKSLLALGNCINSLADGLRHVPYRDSKLTRLLKDSLGGNCQTVMIANVSPSSLTYEDTYNTLKYATRAKKIKSTMKQNVVNVDLHVGHYVKLVEELRAEVARLKAQAEVAPPPQDENVEEMREEMARLKEEVAKFEEEVASLKGQLEDNQKTDELETLQKECDRLRGILENVDSAEEGLTEVMALISEKKEIIERQLKLETIESATAMRRILKEEIDTRLNDICPLSTNTKMNRFGSVIERLKKEEAALKANIDEVSDQAAKVDRRLKDIVTEQPRLKKHVEEQQLKLKCLKFKHYIQLEQKTSQLLLDERRADMALIEKMSSALKSFYTLLQGNELLTPAITKQYQDIGATLQERKDSDKCEKNVGAENSRSMCNKRKIEEGSTDNEVLDKTFSMPVAKAAPVSEPAVVKPARTVKAIAPPPMTSKVLKVPPVKRLNNQRPMGFRRPFESNTLAAARSLVTVKSTSSFRGTTKTPTKTDRPRFRS